MDVEVAAPERSTAEKPLPFNADHLDRLMDEAGLDVLVLNSKHNIQYLLGGYRFFFFDAMDAIGVSRYLPIIVYTKGRPQDAGYIGNTMEAYERDLGKFWMPSVQTKSWSSQTSAQLAAEHIQKLGLQKAASGSRWRSCRPMPSSRCGQRCPMRRSRTHSCRWSGCAR